MSLIELPTGIYWPYGRIPTFSTGSGATITLDAATEKVAFIGRILIEGKATNKTLDASGSSKIKFCLASSPIFDNAGSEFRVGFQGIDNTTGFPVRPDGTWSVYTAITTGADSSPALTTTSDYHEKAPTSGTVTLSHGDAVALVFELAARGGALDAVSVAAAPTVSSTLSPAGVTNITGSWASSIGGPQALITFSDGTLGMLEGCLFVPNASAGSALTWNDSSNPDEYGLLFQVPFDCKIDALTCMCRLVDATSDFTLNLWSEAETGTPTNLAAFTLNAENFALASTEGFVCMPLASEISLTANTDYCVSMKAAGAGNVRFTRSILPSAASRIFVGPAGTTIRGVSRNGGSGAFGGSTTTTLYPLGVRISQVQDGAGAGGGMRMAGHGGLAA